MRNGEQRQCKKTNTEKVSHPALYLKAPHSPSSNIPAQIQPVNHHLHELVNYSFIMCPAKPCQAPPFAVVNPLAQAAQPVKAAIVALLGHKGSAWKALAFGV